MPNKRSNPLAVAALAVVAIIVVIALWWASSPGHFGVHMPSFPLFHYQWRKAPEVTRKAFEDTVDEVCKNPIIRIPEFDGIRSVLEHLENVDRNACKSWLHFGGEKPLYELKNGIPCGRQFSKKKAICVEKEYKMIYDPCLIYSFSDEVENNFEKDLSRFNCDVHSFQFIETFGYEEIKRNNRWWQHNWQLSNNLKVIKAPISSTDKLAVFDRKIEKSDVKMMPLQAFVEILGHKKSTISFLNSNQYENVWNLLRHVIVNHATIDVEQIGFGFGLEMDFNSTTGTLKENQNEILLQIYTILKAMACTGYKIARLRPLDFLTEEQFIPELGRNISKGYEINFVKDKSLLK